MYELFNNFIKIGFDPKTGAIVSMQNLCTGYEMIRQPALSLGLTALIPVKDHRNNPAQSAMQELSSFQKSAGGKKVVLTYDKITTDWAGTLAVSVEITVELIGKQAIFRVKAENKSPYVVEEIRYPCFGGLASVESGEGLASETLNFLGELGITSLTDGFANPNYYGTDWPTLYTSFPSLEMSAPFILLARETQGLYLGVHRVEPEFVGFVQEYKPGYADNRRHRLLRDQEIPGVPAGFCFSVSQLPFIQPGESQELNPVVAEFYEGDWHNGIRPYLEWRKSWYHPVKCPAWLKDTDCWMTLHINSPEGCCRHKYTELPEMMKKAKEKGVQVLQLIGWARGGQDGDEPYQDINPLLGTKEELKEAIKKIEEMGIHVLLMCKFKWADQSTPEYQQELLPHTIKDIYGNPAQFGGYCYQTTLQNVTVGSRRYGTGLCHLSKGYREIALREFDKILDLEPSGILYDELGNPFQLCFDPHHGHKPGASIQVGSLQLAKEFYDRARERMGEDFFFAGEGPLDVESQYYRGTYIRSDDGGMNGGPHIPGWKFINPEMYIATCVVGYDDREMVNQCLAFGYAINYEILNFKGLPNDAPLTAEYVMQARKLRKNLSDYLWTGIFRHTVGVSVLPQGEKSEFIYSRFENRHNGKSAVVVVNDSIDTDLCVQISLGKPDACFTVYEIGKEETSKSKGLIQIPPRSLCVCVEE